MTLSLKQKTIMVIGVLAIIVSVLFAVTRPPQVLGNATVADTVYMTKGGGSYTATAPATTTAGVTYLAVNATTTFPFYTERANLVGITVQMTASTSAGTLVLTYETSNSDGSCATDPNTCDWSNPATVTSGAAASTTPLITWRPDGALNATSTLYYVINPVAAKFYRVKASVTGSAAALWLSATNKIENL